MPQLYFQRDSITLYCGDCRAVLPSLPSVAAVVTDPPYCLQNRFGVQYREPGKGHRRLEWDFDTQADPGTMEKALIQAAAIATNAIFSFVGSDYLSPWSAALRREGFTVKPAAWVKKCPPPAGKGNWWPSGFELAMYGYRKGAWFGDMYKKRSNVFVYDGYRHGQPGKTGHPTQKPLRMMEKIIASICPPDGTVLDPFAGSGSTGVACIRTGRKFIGIEIEERYCEMAAKRLEAAFDSDVLFASNAP